MSFKPLWIKRANIQIISSMAKHRSKQVWISVIVELI